jgi:hypothetical protein
LTRILAAALLCLLAAGTATAQAPPGDWRDARVYLPLFAPSGPRAAAYHIYVTPLDIQAVLKQISSDSSTLHAPGSWMPTAQLPSDAFGQTGRYDRSRLARLYGATRAMVARGPRGSAPSTPLGTSPSTAFGASRPREGWTLISPYPSGDMQRLEPGTMLIVVDLGHVGAP